MKRLTPFLTASTLLSLAGAYAAPTDFDFKDPKGVNNIVFQMDAPLESINGTGDGITGTVSFDPDRPEAIKGTIVLDATSLTVPNGSMQDHMQGEGWLDTASFPKITFEAISLANPETEGTTTTGELSGKLTVKGVTQELTVPLKITFLEGKLKERGGTKQDGDLLVLRSQFSINRSDFGIKPGQNTDKVSEEIVLSLSLVGMAPY
jgi:polyisoprenoid-binding protein YceI